MSSKKIERAKKNKPMAGGVKIQQLCPVAPVPNRRAEFPGDNSWRVAMLVTMVNDAGKKFILLDPEGDPKVLTDDIACWALVVGEDKSVKFQEIIPCVPDEYGGVEPFDADFEEYIGIITPTHSEQDIVDMAVAKAEALGYDTLQDDDSDDDPVPPEDKDEDKDEGNGED